MSNSWEALARALYDAERPKTLNEAIRKFLSSLELSDRQAQLVADRQKAVRERAETNSTMDIEDSLLIGSYPRDTQIRPLDSSAPALDVDALLILKVTDWNLDRYWKVNDGGTKLIQDTHAALKGFQGVVVGIDRPSVTVRWREMKMELTPAFPRKGGGYLIPAKDFTTTRWTETDPISDAAELTKANKGCSDELKPLIKMLKCWNRHQGKLVGSFAVEVQTYLSARHGYRGFSFEIPHFFDELLKSNGTSLTPPSGIGDPVAISLGWQAQEAIKHSKLRAQRAFYEAERGNHNAAISILAGLFGRPFPGASS